MPGQRCALRDGGRLLLDGLRRRRVPGAVMRRQSVHDGRRVLRRPFLRERCLRDAPVPRRRIELRGLARAVLQRPGLLGRRVRSVELPERRLGLRREWRLLLGARLFQWRLSKRRVLWAEPFVPAQFAVLQRPDVQLPGRAMHAGGHL